MNRTTLLALAERVEAATEHDRALAKDIYRALFVLPEMGHPNGYGWREDDSGWWLATGEDARTPPKTIYPPKWLTSLDAAMSLAKDDERSELLNEAMEAVSLNGWKNGEYLQELIHAFVAASLRAIAGSMTE